MIWRYTYKFKDRHIKNHTYYFFDDIVKTKNFDQNKIKRDEKSYKNILILHWICDNKIW